MSRLKTRVTMQDVARSLGVDHSTVSLALRCDPRISARTRDRVRHAARVLNYLPPNQARAFQGERPRVMGVVVPELRSDAIAATLDGIQRVAERNRSTVALNVTDRDAAREARAIERLCAERVDGIIWSAIGQDQDATYERFAKVVNAGVKLVVLGEADVGADVNRVCCSEREAARLAAEHVRSLGHRRLGLAAATDSPGHVGARHRDRIALLHAALNDVGLRVRAEDCFAAADVLTGGVAIAGEIARRAPAERPTVVIAPDDLLARTLIAGLALVGVRVPEDVSVLGYDEGTSSETNGPIPATSISLRSRDVGRSAGRRLVELIEGTDADGPRSIMLMPHLVGRGSCAAWLAR